MNKAEIMRLADEYAQGMACYWQERRAALEAAVSTDSEPVAWRDEAIHVAASLAAAISLLEHPACKKAAPSDRMFEVMLGDYRKALSAFRVAFNAAPVSPPADSEPVQCNPADYCAARHSKLYYHPPAVPVQGEAVRLLREWADFDEWCAGTRHCEDGPQAIADAAADLIARRNAFLSSPPAVQQEPLHGHAFTVWLEDYAADFPHAEREDVRQALRNAYIAGYNEHVDDAADVKLCKERLAAGNFIAVDLDELEPEPTALGVTGQTVKPPGWTGAYLDLPSDRAPEATPKSQQEPRDERVKDIYLEGFHDGAAYWGHAEHAGRPGEACWLDSNARAALSQPQQE